MATPDQLPPGRRVVMLSGASRGIGAAIAKRLLGEGYRLSLGLRQPGTLPAGLKEAPADLLHVSRYDALDAASAERWIDETVDRFGVIDALVNNAGLFRQVDFSNYDEEQLDELWAVNVKGPFRLLRLALPHLRRTGHGRVVNIASTDGKRYRDATVSIGYAMSKHAVVVLSHAARFAGWEDGVRVTAVCPGPVDTGLMTKVRPANVGPPRIPPETIARAVDFALRLPNEASMAELTLNSRLESTL